MNKLLGGGIAAGLAAAGTLAFALPSSAQEPKTVSVLTPEIQQSQAVQLESGEASECVDTAGAAGQVVLSAEHTGGEFPIDPGAPIPANADPAAGPIGTWAIDFSVLTQEPGQDPVPIPFAVGDYAGHATCQDAAGTELFQYEDFAFTVVPDPGAPTDPAPPAEPAPPAPANPQGDREDPVTG